MEPAGVIPIALSLEGPRGVNAFLVLGERPVLVDTGVPGSEGRILEVLATVGVEPCDVALILLTHAHGDHTGSAWALKQATGAPVAIQRLDAPHLAAGESAPVEGRTPEARRFVEKMKVRRQANPFVLRAFSADLIIGDELPLTEFGVRGRAIHTPGHTDGGLSVVIDGGDAIVGDLVGSDPKAPGTPAPAMLAVNAEKMDASIKRIVALAPHVVYAGHEGPFTLEQMRAAFPL
jgi:hydroxyacylglutathione hydrolase